MFIKKLRLENFQCYRGEEIVDLQPTFYAIVAKHNADPTRSNWGGKTSLVEAIKFAFFGSHRHRYEDDWITQGEKKGSVELTLSEGTKIIRSRTRGHSTKLVVTCPDGTAKKKDDAQAWIEALLGLGESDFKATSFFEQRQTAKLILSSPGERMELVSKWLRIEKLVQCAHETKQALGKLGSEAVAFRKVRDDWEKCELKDSALLREELSNLEIAIAAELKQVESFDRLLGQLDKLPDSERLQEEYRVVVDRGKRLREEHDAVANAVEKLPPLSMCLDALATAREALNKFLIENGTKLKVDACGFNGVCPVTDRSCPVQIEVRKVVESINPERYKKTKLDMESICETLEGELSEANRLFQRKSSLGSQLDLLRQQAKRLKDMIDASPKPCDHMQRVEQALRNRDVCATHYKNLLARKDAILASFTFCELGEAQTANAKDELSRLEKQIEIHRAAVEIFGRSGAQQVVAEAAIRQIQDECNAMLAQAGVELSVGVEWSREGKSIASHCEECGHAFARSLKEKTCSRCQAPRGKALIQGLDISLSDRSGAAEDLAGAALQLAASAWIRADRHSAWNVVILDEPFGQLDASNRKAFGTHLVQLLKNQYAVEQAFVISHSPDVTNHFPARIEIVRFKSGSRLTAVS